MIDVYHEIKEKMFFLCKKGDLLSQPIRVRARVLTAEEAIGNPEADDFPLKRAKRGSCRPTFLMQ